MPKRPITATEYSEESNRASGEAEIGEGKEQPQRLELFCETIPEMPALAQDA